MISMVVLAGPVCTVLSKESQFSQLMCFQCAIPPESLVLSWVRNYGKLV